MYMYLVSFLVLQSSSIGRERVSWLCSCCHKADSVKCVSTLPLLCLCMRGSRNGRGRVRFVSYAHPEFPVHITVVCDCAIS